MVGAAVASAAAYLTSSAALLVCFFAVRKLDPCAPAQGAGRGGCVVTGGLRPGSGGPRSWPWPGVPSRSPGRSPAAAQVPITVERPGQSPQAAAPAAPGAAGRLPDRGGGGRARSPPGVDRGRHGEAVGEGPASFRAAVTRVAALSRRPGVVGIKIADELGYNDGMDSAAEVRRFLSDTARALHAAAPHKLILVNMVVPQLGCLPGHQLAAPAPWPAPGRRMPATRRSPSRRSTGTCACTRSTCSTSAPACWPTAPTQAGNHRRCGAGRSLAGGTRRGWPSLVQAAGPQGARASGTLSRRPGPGGFGRAPVRRHPARLRRTGG